MRGDELFFITAIQSRSWYDFDDFTTGPDNYPSYVRHAPINPGSAIIARGLVTSGTMLLEDDSWRLLPVVVLSHPVIQERQPRDLLGGTGELVALPLAEEEIGLILKLTKVRLE